MKIIVNMKGSTIIEALIAFLIFGLASLTLTGFLSNSLEMNTDGKSRTQAMHLAKDVFEDFRNFSSHAEVLAYSTSTTGDTITGDFTTFTRTWTVADAGGTTNAYIVTVNVAWTGISGAESLSLTSKIAKLKPDSAGEYLL